MNEFSSYIPLIIGLALIGIALFVKSFKASLKETGVHVEGIIFEKNTENFSVSLGDTGNTSNTNNKVVVRFVTLEEKIWITSIDQGFQFYYTGQFKKGNKVDVYYDKDNPYNFYVDMEKAERFSKIIFGFVGGIFIIGGLYNLFIK